MASALARRFLDTFAGYEAIVAPSGSCVAHVRAHVPELAADPDDVAERTLDLSEFLVDRLDADDVGSAYAGKLDLPPHVPLAPHAPARRPAQVAPAVGGGHRPSAARRRDGVLRLRREFALRNADVSTAMLSDKLRRVEETGAEAVCACDASCLLHLRGGLERRGSPTRAVHLAEVLAT